MIFMLMSKWWNSVYGTQLVCLLYLSLVYFILAQYSSPSPPFSFAAPLSGQEEFDRLRSLSYAETHVVMICFSVDNPVSLENVESKVVREFVLAKFYLIFPTAVA